ncbi:MAG: hypothetical protein J6T60_07280 [Bacteroidales bacterium]|nr:hypothetical protein [Bacteroidales bacterium]
MNKQEINRLLSNFSFQSDCHQRYENGVPVMGLQECSRLIEIKRNINGCRGYMLDEGDGFILYATNGDTGNPQFAPKPMRLVQVSDSEILLQGYSVFAQTPFGFQEVDLSDYGFSIFLKNGEPHKCVLHMYDRNVRLEYRNKAKEDILKYLGDVFGTAEKPVQVENKKLKDGTIYTGEARMCTDGFYLPNGYGKKIFNQNVEMTGYWKHGYVDGMCYMNMHHSMITGHFKGNHPDGWCISIEGGRGFVFGVFQNDDCVYSLGECVAWMVDKINYGLRVSYKIGQIFLGDAINKQYRGFHFMNNGDVYVGTDDASRSKTGYFFKFTKDGYIQVGYFANGELVKEMPSYEVVDANECDSLLLEEEVDTTKKYF